MPSFRSGIAQRPNSRPDNQPASPRERSHRMPVTHSAHEWRAAPLTEEESAAKFKETVGEAYAATNEAAGHLVRACAVTHQSSTHCLHAPCRRTFVVLAALVILVNVAHRLRCRFHT